jgi:hypothetical protein
MLPVGLEGGKEVFDGHRSHIHPAREGGDMWNGGLDGLQGFLGVDANYVDEYANSVHLRHRLRLGSKVY